MPFIKQVIGGGSGRRYVVDKQIVKRPGTHALAAGLDPYNGDVALKERQEFARGKVKEYSDNPIDAPLEKAVEAFEFLGADSVGVIDQQIISVRLGTVLRAPFESRVKRIGDVWDDAGDGPGLLRA